MMCHDVPRARLSRIDSRLTGIPAAHSMWHGLMQFRQFLRATPDATKMGKGFVCPTSSHVHCTTDVLQILFFLMFSMILYPSLCSIFPNLSNAHFRASHRSSKCGPSREPRADQTLMAQLVTLSPAQLWPSPLNMCLHTRQPMEQWNNMERYGKYWEILRSYEIVLHGGLWRPNFASYGHSQHQPTLSPKQLKNI